MKTLYLNTKQSNKLKNLLEVQLETLVDVFPLEELLEDNKEELCLVVELLKDLESGFGTNLLKEGLKIYSNLK